MKIQSINQCHQQIKDSLLFFVLSCLEKMDLLTSSAFFRQLHISFLACSTYIRQGISESAIVLYEDHSVSVFIVVHCQKCYVQVIGYYRLQSREMVVMAGTDP